MINLIKKFQTHLTLFSVILAIVLGVLTPNLFDSVQFLGELFIKLLKLFALPLICSALIASIGDVRGQMDNLKSVARRMLSYMFLSEIMAVTIALCLFNFFRPGAGLNPDLILQNNEPVTAVESKLSFSNFILSIFPHNIFESLSKFELLPVVIFSILFGIGCSRTREKAKPVVVFAISVREIASNCLHGVMLLAPLGIFALVGTGVAQAHLKGSLQSNAIALFNFVIVLTLGLILHGLWQLLWVVMTTKQSIFTVLKKSLPVFSTAFGTSSSMATLPVAMQTADELQSNPAVTRFMLPLCASINVGGMMMYEVSAALFFSQMLGVELGLPQQILLAGICIVGGMAEGGIPETSLVSMVAVFKMVNVPISAISILLPLDRILDRFRTMVNIFGNMCGAIIVSHFDATTENTTESHFIVDPSTS